MVYFLLALAPGIDFAVSLQLNYVESFFLAIIGPTPVTIIRNCYTVPYKGSLLLSLGPRDRTWPPMCPCSFWPLYFDVSLRVNFAVSFSLHL